MHPSSWLPMPHMFMLTIHVSMVRVLSSHPPVFCPQRLHVDHTQRLTVRIQGFRQQTPAPSDEDKAEFFKANIRYHDGSQECETATGWAFVPEHTLGLCFPHAPHPRVRFGRTSVIVCVRCARAPVCTRVPARVLRARPARTVEGVGRDLGCRQH